MLLLEISRAIWMRTNWTGFPVSAISWRGDSDLSTITILYEDRETGSRVTGTPTVAETLRSSVNSQAMWRGLMYPKYDMRIA